ncbi:MAG: DUF1702 family protein [Pseudonocardia sp.]
MSIPFGTILKPLFPLSADAFPRMAAARFGPQPDMDETWKRFEPVARTLVDSFSLSLDHSDPQRLAAALDEVRPELRGIAYEGAGMGLTLLDCLVPHRSRLATFVNGPGAPYRGLIYIGAGLVLPRVPRNTSRFLARQDPFHRGFVMDGYGFHEGFFAWRRTIGRHARPTSIGGYALNAFDHGLGRSLWFSTGANVDRIISTIDMFPPARQGDLWSGIGLACAYAAGVMDNHAVRTLLAAAGPHRADVAVGVAIASVFREQSGLPAPHTDLASDVVWAREASDLAATAVRLSTGLRDRPTGSAYQQWRTALRAAWVADPARLPVEVGA